LRQRSGCCCAQEKKQKGRCFHGFQGLIS
jgi:hypothetical protein